MPHESAIWYVRVIVLGQVPLSVCVIVNEEAFNEQLSEAVPPPAIKVANVVKAGGMFALHSPVIFPGQVIIGGVISSMMIV